jgi:hypothetical protein
MESMNIVEEYDHSSNDGYGCMDMVEERLLNHRPEDESTDMVEECSSNHRPEVEGIDR